MVTNKEIAEAFKKAVPYLRIDDNYHRGGTQYICHAIAYGDTNQKSCDAQSEPAKKAVEIIEKRLGDENSSFPHTMRTWLKSMGVRVDELTENRVQAHRLAWLNMLIEEFSNG